MKSFPKQLLHSNEFESILRRHFATFTNTQYIAEEMQLISTPTSKFKHDLAFFTSQWAKNG